MPAKLALLAAACAGGVSLFVASDPSTAAPTGTGYGPASTAPAPSASASPSSPFETPPSPSPPAPGVDGYVAASLTFGSASGGRLPPSGANPTPAPFPAGSAHGFVLDAFGRLSGIFAASLRFQSDSVRNGDAPVVTRGEGAILLAPASSRVAGGIAYGSFSRSSAPTSSSGLGVAVALPPGTLARPRPYGALAYYPSLRNAGANERFSALTYDGGVLVPVGGATGAFVRAGITGAALFARSFSPTTGTALHVGLGIGF